MPPLVCPRCQRVNPPAAVYCYFDGNVLRPDAATGRPNTAILPQDFVFPSRRRCRSLEDFVQGCQYEWEEARELLRKGHIAHFFQTIGRQDLARAAIEAATQTDADVALHTFLGSLPASNTQGPKLDLKPRRVILSHL